MAPPSKDFVFAFKRCPLKPFRYTDGRGVNGFCCETWRWSFAGVCRTVAVVTDNNENTRREYLSVPIRPRHTKRSPSPKDFYSRAAFHSRVGWTAEARPTEAHY